MHKFIFTLLLAVLPPAHAQAAQTNLWHCSIRAKLKVDVEFFMRYGRDSLVGRADMHCMNSRSALVIERTLLVTFNGADIGYGLNQTTSATIDFQMTTHNSPIDFQFYGFVYNRANPPEINWLYESSGMTVTVEVRTFGSPGAARSLQKGNLFIR